MTSLLLPSRPRKHLHPHLHLDSLPGRRSGSAVRVKVRAWAAAIGCALFNCLAPAHAAEPPAPIPTFGDSPCVERPQPAASGQPPAPPARIPGLRYECHVMTGGQPLFVGRAGPADPPANLPVLLLIHGLGQNAHTDWAEPVQALASRFQIVAVDLPGFGASPPPLGPYAFDTLGRQLAQLVTRLAPGRRVHVVGHSLGGAVALHFAHRHAALVDRLVLVDAAGLLLKQVFMRHMTAQAVPSTGVAPLDAVIRGMGGRLRDLGSYLFLGQDARFDFLPWLMGNPQARKALLGGVVQADAAITLVEQDFTAALRETTVPTTLIWGSEDRIAPPRTGRILAARMPQVRLQVMAGAGHTPMAERPGEFNRLLLDALTGPVPPRSAGFAPGTTASTRSQGELTCQAQDGARYSGRIDKLTLNGCRNVRIEGAQIGALVLSDALATLDDSSIDAGRGVAIDARNSELIVTTSRIRARVAIRAENSWFDLAGVSLTASEAAMQWRDATSRAFFSLSDWDAPEHRGDAHFMWPRTAAGAQGSGR
ncbi:hypothetical protein CATMQ487_03310 [Sphaerotilus microaerophilus]|uniref:AB hydrolase-1 domain-containing protein n=2 Tax=Sphaerotilus microaerophilus TaxID=2914710 RepID=A0ABM7YGR6_9BURK|nr:hypothetical protein CATMQ487_03310 [Sphaerotilus sp. FB-5]